jgi:hypothetical protein
MKHAIPLNLLLCLVSPLSLAPKTAKQAPVSVPSVTQEIVWNPSRQILAAIREKCGKGDPDHVDECFLSEMRSTGASPQSVEFAKSRSTEGLAFIRAFRKVGPVDVAFIEYPFRANELDGVLLVNGEPPIIDVDSPKFLSPDNFSADSTYATSAKKYPDISIWPGDRYHANKPVAKRLESGGQSFVVEYILRDGCHACAQVGTVKLRFVFDKHGKFSGVESGPTFPRP